MTEKSTTKNKILTLLTNEEINLYESSLWGIIKTTDKYANIDSIEDITEEPELKSLYNILNVHGDEFDYIRSQIKQTDNITDIYNKIEDDVDRKNAEYGDTYLEEEEVKTAIAAAPTLTAKDLEIVEFNESICDDFTTCRQINIDGILTLEEQNNKNMFSPYQVDYKPGAEIKYTPDVSVNPNNLKLIKSFNERLLAAMGQMGIAEYKIQKIKYRIQITHNVQYNQGLYLHREKKDLLSFWVFQHINCSNTGTVIAKRVGDKAHVAKIPDDMAVVVNDSIYAHKAPKTWDFSSSNYTRSILVAEIELDENVYRKGREIMDHDLSNILNMTANLAIPIGGAIRKRKTNKRKNNKRKTNKRKNNKRKTNKPLTLKFK
jgi:hypothetical protein